MLLEIVFLCGGPVLYVTFVKLDRGIERTKRAHHGLHLYFTFFVVSRLRLETLLGLLSDFIPTGPLQNECV